MKDEKQTINPRELTLDDMMKFIERLPKEQIKEAKQAFKANAYTERKHKTAQPMFDVEGKPIMKQSKNKDGSLKFDANGNPVMYQAKQMVEVKGDSIKVFSLLKAQRYFLATYMPDLLPKKHEKPKASDKLANW